MDSYELVALVLGCTLLALTAFATLPTPVYATVTILFGLGLVTLVAATADQVLYPASDSVRLAGALTLGLALTPPVMGLAFAIPARNRDVYDYLSPAGVPTERFWLHLTTNALGGATAWFAMWFAASRTTSSVGTASDVLANVILPLSAFIVLGMVRGQQREQLGLGPRATRSAESSDARASGRKIEAHGPTKKRGKGKNGKEEEKKKKKGKKGKQRRNDLGASAESVVTHDAVTSVATDDTWPRHARSYLLSAPPEFTNTVYLIIATHLTLASIYFRLISVIKSAKSGAPEALTWDLVALFVLGTSFLLVCGLRWAHQRRYVYLTFLTGTPVAMGTVLFFLALLQSTTGRNVFALVYLAITGAAYGALVVWRESRLGGEAIRDRVHHFTGAIALVTIGILVLVVLVS